MRCWLCCPTWKHNSKLQAAQKPQICMPLVENDDNFFEGFLSDDGSAIARSTITQLPASSSIVQNCNSSPDISMITTAAASDGLVGKSINSYLPLKRTLHSPYWNEGLPCIKRFLPAGNDVGSNSSMAALLNQMPNGASAIPSFQKQNQHGLFGTALDDGVLRQQYQLYGMNWDY